MKIIQKYFNLLLFIINKLQHVKEDIHDKNANSNQFVKEIKNLAIGFAEIRKKEQL